MLAPVPLEGRKHAGVSLSCWHVGDSKLFVQTSGVARKISRGDETFQGGKNLEIKHFPSKKSFLRQSPHKKFYTFSMPGWSPPCSYATVSEACSLGKFWKIWLKIMQSNNFSHNCIIICVFIHLFIYFFFFFFQVPQIRLDSTWCWSSE